MMACKRILAALVGLTLVAPLVAGCTAQTALEKARQLAEDFVRGSATFEFDGMGDTLELTETLEISEPDSWTFGFEFDSRHAGFGDRTGMVLAQVITHHEAMVTVTGGEVVHAVLDGEWDMLAQEETSDGVDPDDAVTPPPVDFVGRVTGIEAAGEDPVRGLVTAESETDASQKYVITVTGETALLGLDGETVGFEALQETQEIRVWFSGPVKESFPMQVDAGMIVISQPAR